MNNTDQNGYSGRTMTPAGHYHNGQWYNDSKCRCKWMTCTRQMDQRLGYLPKMK